ncbi:hypothetical protein MRB53_037625 [Persea americana]|nr:hypothetical protein MRB53_037625 [Persea americana]
MHRHKRRCTLGNDTMHDREKHNVKTSWECVVGLCRHEYRSPPADETMAAARAVESATYDGRFLRVVSHRHRECLSPMQTKPCWVVHRTKPV